MKTVPVPSSLILVVVVALVVAVLGEAVGELSVPPVVVVVLVFAMSVVVVASLGACVVLPVPDVEPVATIVADVDVEEPVS